MFEIEGKYAVAKVFAENVEESCTAQITQMANHPAFDLRETGDHIAIMPDTHAGKGSVIGFTMPLQHRVVSNVVGLDIGCGMAGVRFRPRKHFELAHLDKVIRERVPMGTKVHADPQTHTFFEHGPRGLFFDWVNSMQSRLWDKLCETHSDVPRPPEIDAHHYEHLCKRVGMNFERAQASLGTLGGGNHFIELGRAEDAASYWLVVHTGSRQLGKKICEYWQEMATQQINEGVWVEYRAGVRQIREETSVRSDIPEKILALKKRLCLNGPKGNTLDYLEGENFYGYLWDMVFAQAYAEANRAAIMKDCLKIMKVKAPMCQMRIDAVHNYIDFTDLVIRKGAISARVGKYMILPFNMRDGTLICAGLGNPDWNQSAPHGAGRLLPRGVARRTLSASRARKQMQGIYTSCIPLDEVPDAYKDSQVIEASLAPTAKIIERVKPVLNIKDGEE